MAGHAACYLVKRNVLAHVLMQLVPHFPKMYSMIHPIHAHLPTHTKKITHKNCCTHTHTQTHRLTLPLYKTQQSSKICTTSFCSQTKSLKANRCFHVIIASYRSSLPLIRLYFLTQMLRSSIYQMYQKEQPGSWRDE